MDHLKLVILEASLPKYIVLEQNAINMDSVYYANVWNTMIHSNIVDSHIQFEIFSVKQMLEILNCEIGCQI